MRFLGPPWMAVVDKRKKREIGRFDEGGELEVCGADLIERMKTRFAQKPESEENTAGEIKTKKKKTKKGEQHDGTTGI